MLRSRIRGTLKGGQAIIDGRTLRRGDYLSEWFDVYGRFSGTLTSDTSKRRPEKYPGSSCGRMVAYCEA